MKIISRNKSKFLDGVTLLEKAIRPTYGPNGGTLILEVNGTLIPSQDGLTIARTLHEKDPHLNNAIKSCLSVCEELNDVVGDGTSTVVLVLASLLKEMQKLSLSYNPRSLVQELEEIELDLLSSLDQMSKLVHSSEKAFLMGIANSANKGDPILSEVVVEAVTGIGKYGNVLIEDGNRTNVCWEIKEGIEVPSGKVSPIFVEENFTAPLLAIFDYDLISFLDIQEVLEEATQFPDNPLIVMAPYFGTEVLATFSLNQSQKTTGAIKTPGGDRRLQRLWEEDLASISGATVVRRSLGMKSFKSDWFGSFRSARINDQRSVFFSFDDKEELLFQRIQELKSQKINNSFDGSLDDLNQRIARLSGGQAVIQTGGHSESELKIQRAQLEDILGAVNSAIDGGICLGGGVTLHSLSRSLTSAHNSDVTRAVQKALKRPLWVLAENSGASGAWVCEKIKEKTDNVGWDVFNQSFRDFWGSPSILVPTQTIRESLRTAFSICRMIILTEVFIFEGS